MAVQVYTEEELFNSALGYFRLTFQGLDLSDNGFLGLLARDFARFFVLAQQEILQVGNDSVPAYQQDADGQIRSKCSSEALDAWAFVFGLPSGTPGVYGRRGPTISTGGIGVPGTTLAPIVIPAGSQANDSTGQVVVQTTATLTTNGPPNNLPIQFVSVSTGTAANLPAGSVLTWTSPPVGLLPSVTLTSGLAGAKDRESDSDLVARLLRRIQQPPRGGTAADYRTWGEEATDSNGAPLGLTRCYGFPLRSGLGSFDLVCTYAGSGLGRRPPAGEIAKAQTYLNRVRPVTATVNCMAPGMPTGLRIRVRVKPSTAKTGAYLYDWDDGSAFTFITAATANTVTCAVVPATLGAALVAGQKPRIQILISGAGAGPIPFIARVLTVGGTTLTLDRSFTVLPVAGFDYFYAGSSVVVPIAERIRDYVDSLGPSRISSYADPNDVWEDRALLERIENIVLETRDSDGTRMVTELPGHLINSTQIAVGLGAFAPGSYRPNDLLATPPELTYLRDGGIEVVS